MNIWIKALATSIIMGCSVGFGWFLSLGEDYATGISLGVSLGFAISIIGHVLPVFKDYTEECDKRRKLEAEVRRLKEMLRFRGWEEQ